MRRNLPPLNALRTFEAAARHLSFTKAAAELNVTQAAVSHQVKALEDNLEVPLFHRLNRRLTLTEHGVRYLPDVRRAFNLLRGATQELRAHGGSGPLTVSVLPSFAARWLVPRLGRFFKNHPDVDLRIDPSVTRSDFVNDDVDVGIRYGRGDDSGLRADRLMEEDIFPVCSPALARRPPGLQCPADLRHFTLLHDESHADWHTWFLAAGVEGIDPARGTIFTDSSMLIQAAIAGQGVALARRVLVADELQAGHLIRPFDLSLSTEYAYYLVCPLETAELPKIVAFREWVLAEARGEAEQQGTTDPGTTCG